MKKLAKMLEHASLRGKTGGRSFQFWGSEKFSVISFQSSEEDKTP